MKIVKGIEKQYINTLKKMHCDLFGSTDFDVDYDFDQVLNLKHCFLMLNDQDEIISFVGISDKLLINENKQYTIGLVGCIMTNVKFQKQGFAKQLLNEAIKTYLQLYDQVIIQAWNWNIYKSFDLITSCTKHQYKYQDSNEQLDFDTNKLIFEPSLNLVKAIINNISRQGSRIRWSDNEINNYLALYKKHNLQFISYNSAYAWYDRDNNVESFMYQNLQDLLVILQYIKPKNTFLLFEHEAQKMSNNLINLNNEIIITKTFKKSKKQFKDINVLDFVM